MFIFHRSGGTDINARVSEYLENPDRIYLLDVRADDEYALSHIPGSIHLPLSALADAEYEMPDKTRDVYVYCQSGQRAGRAVTMLRVLGYDKCVNIGGLNDFKGRTEP